jgi:hypothetical protein
MNPKQLVKRIVRPVVQPVLGRFERRMRAAAEADIAELRRQMDYALPVVLNRISSQAASERGYARSIHELWERVEFVRRELMFELRYAGAQSSEAPVQEKRIVNTEKLAAMGERIRLNLGAGHIAHDEYLNVDSRALPNIDVVADLRDLPFDDSSLSEIYSAHVLEHFPKEELRKVLLPYWVSLLASGGSFVAVVPDMEAMITESAAGRMPFADFLEVTYGAQEYEGDFHFNGFSPDSLVALFEEAGLVDVVVRAAGRRNGLCYEMEVVGLRRAPGTA